MIQLALQNPLAFVALLVLAVLLLTAIRIAQEYQRAVIFRLGREVGVRGPGVYLLIPFLERSVVVSLRTITRQLDTQETVTKDGVAVKINAVMWIKAVDPVRVVMTTDDWEEAVRQAAETALRDTIGQNELDQLLKDRTRTNQDLNELLSKRINPWGVAVDGVEIKDLDIPESMQRAIGREAEAVREKRSRIIKAEGELDASRTMAEAALAMEQHPGSMELRKLQALTEIGAEHNSTIIVAMPLEVASGAALSTAIARSVSVPPVRAA